MQGPHAGHRHDPPRVTAVLAAAGAALALAVAAGAAGPGEVALPSPVAPLSPAPPLAGGAYASAEGVRHRISSRVAVDVSLDAGGVPFAVAATQRLDVRGQGDYSFTIGAPASAVRPAPGSAAVPGLRGSAVVWAGFDPGRRLLASRATLDVAQVRPLLPLRVEPAPGGLRLVNATAVAVPSYTADAEREPLLSYLAALREAVRAGRTPESGFVMVTSRPEPARVTAVAPLHVTGSVGGRPVDLLLGERPVVVPARGRVDLHVRPLRRVETPGLARLGGRELLRVAIGASLQVARARQYAAFLGNPDPTGESETVYRYRTGHRPSGVPVARAAPSGRSTLGTALLVAAIVAGVAGAAALWARS